MSAKCVEDALLAETGQYASLAETGHYYIRQHRIYFLGHKSSDALKIMSDRLRGHLVDCLRNNIVNLRSNP